MFFILVSVNGIVFGDGVSRDAIDPGHDGRVNAPNDRWIAGFLGRNGGDRKQNQKRYNRNPAHRAKLQDTLHFAPDNLHFQSKPPASPGCAVLDRPY
jgi:hypothetical protein